MELKGRQRLGARGPSPGRPGPPARIGCDIGDFLWTRLLADLLSSEIEDAQVVDYRGLAG